MKRTPLERRTPLRAKSGLERGSGPERRTPIKKVNRERLARLRKQQFDTGDGGYYEDIKSLACIVTGRSPVEAAHVLRDRSVGGGPEGMAPLHEDVHRDFDDGMLRDHRFQERWGVSRADIRAWAVQHRAAWEAERAEEACA